MPIEYSIHVTDEIIRSCKDLGIVEDIDIIGDKCPVALAIKHLFPQVHVSNEYIFPRGMDTEMKIPMPAIAVDFINKFDSLSTDPDKRSLIKGFKFDILIPDEVIEGIDICNDLIEIRENPIHIFHP